MDDGTSRPKACYHCPFNKRAVLNWFLCTINAIGTYPEPVWNKEATQNGFGPCGNPFHGNEEWHLLQQLWCNTNRQKKQLRLVRRFGHFLRRLTKTHTHGEMVISTDTDFPGDGGQSTRAHIVINIPNMLVGDFQSKSNPVHQLFQYSDGTKRVHLTKLVI